MNKFRRILKWIGIILGVWLGMLVLLVGAAIIQSDVIGIPPSKDKAIAKNKASEFCATVIVGQPIEGIQERAIASGALKSYAHWSTEADGSQRMLALFPGIMPPFSRHICSIRATKVVTSANYTYQQE